MSNEHYVTQVGGTKVVYDLSKFPTNCQITVGGRITGSCKVTYRPYLPGKPVVEATDYETPPNNTINFAPQTGVITHTFILKDIRLSKLIIDDTGSTGDFWVQIVQY